MYIYQTIHPIPPFLSVCTCVGVHTYYITLPKTLLSLSFSLSLSTLLLLFLPFLSHQYWNHLIRMIKWLHSVPSQTYHVQYI